ncbi:peptidase T [Salmonella sp. NCTC 11881]|nr:peptidase T [Salmonella sp. NCTC 11881]
MMEIAKKVGKGLHPDCYIELVIEDSYYNMREKVVEHPHILDIAQQAMRDCHITPEMKTDSRRYRRGATCRLWVCHVLISLPADITIMVNMSL